MIEIKTKKGCSCLMINGEPYIMLAGQVHGVSPVPELMEPVWAKVKAMNLNTVLVSVSWELIEPERGVFDFSTVDHLLISAREHGLHLVFTWLASWVIGASSYVPAWVKTDRATYFRARDTLGRETSSLSPFCEAARDADARAFARFMAHIREKDEAFGTVLMVQVENESGVAGTPVDTCPAAKAARCASVPEELIRTLSADKLSGSLAAYYTGDRSSWDACFGLSADECFLAWHTARYVNTVAEAGKRAYSIPMYVNIWTSQYPSEPAVLRPSGGADLSVIPLWKAAAPAIDAYAPDLYEENFAAECVSYGEAGPLLIPELRYDRWAAPQALYGVTAGALLVSPYSINRLDVKRGSSIPAVVQGVHQTMSLHNSAPMLSALYKELSGMTRLITEAREKGTIFGVLQGRLVQDGFDSDTLHVRVSFPYLDRADKIPGALMAIREDEKTFLVLGFNVRFDIFSRRGLATEIINITEGSFASGEWVPGRRLSGDEMRLSLPETPTILRVRVDEFAEVIE